MKSATLTNLSVIEMKAVNGGEISGGPKLPNLPPIKIFEEDAYSYSHKRALTPHIGIIASLLKLLLG